MSHKTVLGGTASPSGIDYMSFIFHHIISGEADFRPMLFVNGLKKSAVSSKSGFCNQGRGTLPFPFAILQNNGNYRNLFLCVKTNMDQTDYMNEITVTFHDLYLLVKRYSKWVRRKIRNYESASFKKDSEDFFASLELAFPKQGVPLSEGWGIVLQSMLQEIGVKGIERVMLEDIIRQSDPQRFLSEVLLKPYSAEELRSILDAGNVVFKNMLGGSDEEDSVIVVKSDDNFVVHHPPVRFLLWDKSSQRVLHLLEPLSIEYLGDDRVVIETSQKIKCRLEDLKEHIFSIIEEDLSAYQTQNLDLIAQGRGAFLISQLLLAGNIVSYPWYFADDVKNVKAVSLIEHWREKSQQKKVDVGSFFEHVFPLHAVDPERFTSGKRLNPTGSTILECVSFEPARRLAQVQIPFLRIDFEDQELFTQMTAHYFYSRQALSSYKSRSGAIRNDLFQWILDENPPEALKHSLRDVEKSAMGKNALSVKEAFSQVVTYRLLISDLLELPSPQGEGFQSDISTLRDNIEVILKLTEWIRKSETIERLKHLSGVHSSYLAAFLDSAELCCAASYDQAFKSLEEHLNKRDAAYHELTRILNKAVYSEEDLKAMLQDLQELSPYPLQNGLIKRVTGGKAKVLGKKIYSCKTLERRLEVLTGLLVNAYPRFVSLQTQEKAAVTSAILSWIDTEQRLWLAQSEIVRPFAKCRDALDGLMAELVEYLCYLASGPLRSNLFLLWSLFGTQTINVVQEIIQRRGALPVIVRKIRKEML